MVGTSLVVVVLSRDKCRTLSTTINFHELQSARQNISGKLAENNSATRRFASIRKHAKQQQLINVKIHSVTLLFVLIFDFSLFNENKVAEFMKKVVTRTVSFNY